MENTSIMDRIKTIEDAFEATGRPKVDFSNFPEDLREYFEGQYNAVVLTEALNEGFKPDWDNWDERKYRPWFNMSPSAFGFGGANFDSSDAVAGTGSRLCNPTREIARYSAEQFKDVWKKVQLG